VNYARGPKENEFLDESNDARGRGLLLIEMAEFDDEALELDELRAERDQFKDTALCRALATQETRAQTRS